MVMRYTFSWKNSISWESLLQTCFNFGNLFSFSFLKGTAHDNWISWLFNSFKSNTISNDSQSHTSSSSKLLKDLRTWKGTNLSTNPQFSTINVFKLEKEFCGSWSSHIDGINLFKLFSSILFSLGNDTCWEIIRIEAKDQTLNKTKQFSHNQLTVQRKIKKL